MSKVNILPPDVISKIAAGEVIERPASAVKELIENALDAETKNIEIHLNEAGKTLIHIKDTGTGIEKDDIEKIFLRHATSKIKNLDDLNAIQSLGFRGEALYSIAAISDVTLKSKTKGNDSGWAIHLRGGEKIDFKPVTMNNGTEVAIQELFFNTPARRKFLKSNTTELNQILNIIIPYVLFHYDCRFLVKHQNKELLDLKPTSSRKTRIAATLHLDEKYLLETVHSDENQQITVHMILGDINIKRPQKDIQFVCVNGRPVQSKSITFHMNQVYQLIFPPHTYPFFAVKINLPTPNIDVNIHPTKREVKIKNEYQLTSVLRQMCETALMTSGQPLQATKGQSDRATSENLVEKAIVSTRASELSFETPITEEAVGVATPPFYDPYAFPQKTQRPPEAGQPSAETQQTFFPAQKENLQAKLARARFIGSFINKFLLFESDKSLLVIDQHAAQERIAFEKFMEQMESGHIEVQNLLSPILIKLSPQEIMAFEEAKEKLEQIGLSSTMFDGETLALHSYPILLKNPEPAVRYLLSGESIAHCDHATIARRACRSSVMAGDYLNKEKAEFQRDQLMRCRDPFTCPHGRPTVIEMSEKFLDKQFLRT